MSPAHEREYKMWNERYVVWRKRSPPGSLELSPLPQCQVGVLPRSACWIEDDCTVFQRSLEAGEARSVGSSCTLRRSHNANEWRLGRNAVDGDPLSPQMAEYRLARCSACAWPF